MGGAHLQRFSDPGRTAMLLGWLPRRAVKHDGLDPAWLLVGFGLFNLFAYLPFLTWLGNRRRDGQ